MPRSDSPATTTSSMRAATCVGPPGTYRPAHRVGRPEPPVVVGVEGDPGRAPAERELLERQAGGAVDQQQTPRAAIDYVDAVDVGGHVTRGDALQREVLDVGLARGDERRGRGGGGRLPRALGLVAGGQQQHAHDRRGREEGGGAGAVEQAAALRGGRDRGAVRLGLRRGVLDGREGRAAQGAGGGESPVRPLGHRARDHRVDLGRERRPQLAGDRRRVLDVRPQLRRIRVARVRHAPRERLVEHAAQRVDVRARVGAAALDLLGRRVVERADPLAGARERLGVRRPGDAEVGEVGVLGAAALLDQDVRGLDVAVDEAAFVRGVERVGDLGDDARRAHPVQPVLRRQQRAQVGAPDPAHRDEQPPVGFAGLVDRDHVRVVDRGQHARLALEAGSEALVGRQLRRDDLQRHRPVERDLRRAVDGAHAALAGHPLDAVAGESLAGCELSQHSRALPSRE
jgi:hypothetical protein